MQIDLLVFTVIAISVVVEIVRVIHSAERRLRCWLIVAQQAADAVHAEPLLLRQRAGHFRYDLDLPICHTHSLLQRAPAVYFYVHLELEPRLPCHKSSAELE